LSSTVVAVLAIVAVAALALLLRRGAGSDAANAPRPDTGPPVPTRDDDPGDDELDEGDEEGESVPSEAPVPITSAGVAVVPFGKDVRLVTLHAPEEDSEWLESSIAAGSVSSVRVQEQIGVARRMGTGVETLHPADFTGARVRRDAEGGWRLETLGREGEFGYMLFETEAAARTSLEMFEHAGVIRRPLDDDGQTVPASAEDFEEARRRFEETERELAIGNEEDEPPPANDWSSRR
jgi:hypothetical protein